MMKKLMRQLSMILAIAMMASCFGGVGFAETEMMVSPLSMTAFKLYNGNSVVKDISLKAGETAELTAKPDAGAALGNVTWSSSNPSVATVVNGLVTAVGAGEADIIAVSEGETQVCKVLVENAISKLQLEPEKLTMQVGQKQQVRAEADADLSDIRWFSSNEKIATVDNGLVTAVAVGTVAIEAMCDGVLASCEVTVSAAELTTITLTPGNAVLKVGGTVQFTAAPNAGAKLGELVWSSSDTAVAVVENGKVTAVGSGEAVITVSCDGVTALCEVMVTAAALTSITITPDTAVMTTGETIELTAAPNAGAELKDIVWSSSDAAVAAVENGKVTAIAPGKAVIKAVCGSVQAVCHVTVNAPLTALEMNLREMTLEA